MARGHFNGNRPGADGDTSAPGRNGAGQPRCEPRDEALAASYVSARERKRVASEPAAPAKASQPLLRFIPIGDFLTEITAPRWLIRDVLEQDTLVLVFGDPEVGKSFLSIDWAACVATGTPWNGCRVKQGPVLYINGEGKSGLNRRFTAWSIVHNCDLSFAPLYIASMTTALTDEVSRAELIAVVAAFMEEHGPPLLIVFDTLARNYGPGDENSTQDMALAIAACDELREMTGAVVALVHHSGHADKSRARGSMALHGAMDIEYRLHRVPESRDTILECTKAKDFEHPEPMQFRITAVELGVQDDEGREITSAVLRKVEYSSTEPEPDAPKRGRPAKYRAVAFDRLCGLYLRALRNVTESGRPATEARVPLETWRDACLCEGMPRNRFNDAFNQLKAGDRVRVEHGFVFPMEGV